MSEQQPNHHDYLSTACWHLDHHRCRLQCKFCASKCHCTCHANPATTTEWPPKMEYKTGWGQ